MNKIFITKSKDQTHEVGKSFARQLKAGDILVFFGNLGSGKTTFIQGLVKGLKVEKRIISPTFIIVRHYQVNNKDIKVFYHIDLYRTASKNDLIGIGLDQIINDKEGIVAIEWGEKLGDLMPNVRTEIKLQVVDDETRKISIEKYE